MPVLSNGSLQLPSAYKIYPVLHSGNFADLTKFTGVKKVGKFTDIAWKKRLYDCKDENFLIDDLKLSKWGEQAVQLVKV